MDGHRLTRTPARELLALTLPVLTQRRADLRHRQSIPAVGMATTLCMHHRTHQIILLLAEVVEVDTAMALLRRKDRMLLVSGAWQK